MREPFFATDKEYQDAVGRIYEEWRNRPSSEATTDFEEWKIKAIEALRAERDEALRKVEHESSVVNQLTGDIAAWVEDYRTEKEAREAAERQVAELREAIREADVTLSMCRGPVIISGCNCDIHAAHKILQAALAQAKKS